MTPRQQKVLDYIRVQKMTTSADICRAFGFKGSDEATLICCSLVDKGKVRRVPAPEGTRSRHAWEAVTL